MLRRLIAGAAVAAALLGISLAAEMPPPAVAANDYAQDIAWLCRPGRADACAADLTTTVIAADGTQTVEAFAADPNAPIDCFYVYPTVSLDRTGNSDMIAGPEEMAVALVQAARFSAKCRVFAPLYRQITTAAMLSQMIGAPIPSDRMLAVNDVRDAWHYYLEHENNGRGVVLIGHSQGAGVLTQLIAEEIDGKPVQEKLISALLIGSSVSVPRGAVVGGVFKSIPACTAYSETGCVISYASFRDTAPPPPDSFFGKPGPWEGPPDPNKTVICTNPAKLGSEGDPQSYFTTGGASLGSPLAPPAWAKGGMPITTRFVSTPGLITTKCVSDERGTYLSVHVNGDPADPRTDDIAGDVIRDGKVVATWGLHLQDVQLAMGDLVRLVGAQADAYGSKAGAQ